MRRGDSQVTKELRIYFINNYMTNQSTNELTLTPHCKQTTYSCSFSGGGGTPRALRVGVRVARPVARRELAHCLSARPRGVSGSVPPKNKKTFATRAERLFLESQLLLLLDRADALALGLLQLMTPMRSNFREISHELPNKHFFVQSRARFGERAPLVRGAVRAARRAAQLFR